MTPAPVGYLCPQCAAHGQRRARPVATGWKRSRSVLRLSATTTIIAVNVLVWLAILVTGGQTSKLTQLLSLTPLGTCIVASNPNAYVPGATAQMCAASPGFYWAPGVATGAFWQVLTSAFTHVDIFHIAFNMLALLFIGTQVERGIGRSLYLGAFGVSALTSALSVMLLTNPATQTLGASGAIFGLMGVLLVIVWKNHGDVRGVLIWLGINVAYTFLGGGSISWQGHIGGLVGGLLAGLVIVYAPRANRIRWQWTGFAALAVVAVIAMVARSVVLR